MKTPTFTRLYSFSKTQSCYLTYNNNINHFISPSTFLSWQFRNSPCTASSIYPSFSTFLYFSNMNKTSKALKTDITFLFGSTTKPPRPFVRGHSRAPSIRSHGGTFISGFSRFPANESLRRTGLMPSMPISLTAKSSFDLPVKTVIKISCLWVSVQRRCDMNFSNAER